MLVKEAKAVARRWVLEEATKLTGFGGAFYHGSTNWLPDDADLPASSDLDVMVVFTEAVPVIKLGKFVYQEVLLEVSSLPSGQLQSPDFVLGQSHLAGSFRLPGIIADPSGQLARLQVAVSRDYAKRRWVIARCEQVRDKIVRGLRVAREADPFHDQVTPWLFATGLTTHVLLVAGMENPTVRRRYLAARELLADYGRSDFYAPLLELLGCAEMSQGRAMQHLDTLAEVFDATKAIIRTPFIFAADLTDSARPVAIDGSRELIERGDHREAIFWIVATYSRCQWVLHHDAPAATRERFDRGYRQLLGDLGIGSFADMRRRGAAVEMFLPRLWEEAEAIMAANRQIEDD